MSIETLLELKKYIEDMEVQVDGEWGTCRTLGELVRDEAMPEVYQKILDAIKAATP